MLGRKNRSRSLVGYLHDIDRVVWDEIWSGCEEEQKVLFHFLQVRRRVLHTQQQRYMKLWKVEFS